MRDMVSPHLRRWDSEPLQMLRRWAQEGDRTLGRLVDWKDQSNYICSLEER
jgi:hypothetical protein